MNDESQPESVPEAVTDHRFTFVRELGRGVLGEAHEVIDEVRSTPVVLKVFVRCEPAKPDEFGLHFESLCRLEHPCLVKYHDVVDPMSDTNLALERELGASGFAYTQEFVDGTDLMTWLRRAASDEELITLEMRRQPTTGDLSVEIGSDELERDAPPSGSLGESELSTGEIAKLTEESASAIVEEMAASEDLEVPLDLIMLRLEHVVPQIVEGLQHLHRFNQVHGFLRPSNILVTRAGKVKLTDYGIVQRLIYKTSGDSPAEAVTLLEAPEHLPYVAPEMSEAATPAGDAYGLGCILFEAIAGFPPSEAFEIIGRRARKLQVPPLAEIVPTCPATWAERIDALLREEPRNRPTLATLVDVVGGTTGRSVSLPRTVLPQPDLFVGQRAVMDQLREYARRVTDEEQMHLVLLQGAQGCGKSTVVEEAAHWLSRRGWLVISGRCFHRESVPYQGWHEIAARIARMIEALPPLHREHLEEARRIAGRIFPVIAPGGAPVEDERISRLAAVRALRRIIDALAEERPILLVIEDLHWASWDSASLLIDLFADEARLPCLVLGTWRTDSKRSEDHFLLRDLELSLLDVHRIPIVGFTKDEARQYLVTRAPGASLDALRSIIRTGRSSPRLLDELVFELEQERLDESLEESSDVLERLLERRMSDLEKAQRSILEILAVASGRVEERWLLRAVVADLAGTVLPGEQTPEALHEALEEMESERLVKCVVDGDLVLWMIAHDAAREVVLESLDDKEQAQLAGRIADAVGERRPDRHDIRFEYQLRAGHVAEALRSAERAAREAERRFAYHRAAKLWRWLVDNEDKLDDPTLEPVRELARVEHLAGQHADAAQLYRQWAEQNPDPVESARIRQAEAHAWLQAGDGVAAVEALEIAYAQFGESYSERWHSSLTEAPQRWLATMSRWNQRLADECRDGAATRAAKVRGELYDFTLAYNNLLLSERAPQIEARFARLASNTQDARMLGLHRIRLATLHAGSGTPERRDRALEWLAEAERVFEKVDDVGVQAELHLHRAILRIRYGEYETARKSLEEVAAINRRAEDVSQNDRRLLLYWQSIFFLYAGQLSEAEQHARQLLHTYRGDRVAASGAYRILARVAMYRGSTRRAEAYVAEGKGAVAHAHPNASHMLWLREETRLHIAMGRPEVAVGRLDVEIQNLEANGYLSERSFDLAVHLCLGQATCALAERQRILAQERPEETRSRIRAVRRHIVDYIDDLNAVRKAETLRLMARMYMVEGKLKKALKSADAAIEALGTVAAPIYIAECMEARGIVLQRMERPEAKGILEQASELYRYVGVSHPLVLEGWPVPRDSTMLKEDTTA